MEYAARRGVCENGHEWSYSIDPREATVDASLNMLDKTNAQNLLRD